MCTLCSGLHTYCMVTLVPLKGEYSYNLKDPTVPHSAVVRAMGVHQLLRVEETDGAEPATSVEFSLGRRS